MSAAASAVLLVGCGKMGGALLGGWRGRGVPPERITVVEPAQAAAEAGRERHGVEVHDEASALDPSFQPAVVVVAVKPQVMDRVVPAYRRFAGADTVFLSIAAGKTIGYFERQLGAEAAIVRAMPNTPAAVARGITVACPNSRVTPAQRSLCGDLLEAVGEVVWIEDEALIDPVTAVSGGGPAYVFLLVECLARAGEEAGLPAELAMRLARATVCGSGELAYRSSEAASVLRHSVTSPGGTTLEALKVLMAEDGLQALFTKAIAAATARSRELAD
ncbi:MAG: pyrroline-5-carboxylate reductase [Alphaproteobacteria bacterium]